ncbi:MAG: SigE family RNA polymerase sigma factor [Micromonosporaceae bacterium]|nr:SigE family RNA polymerase sigma factor [Micromonosporaceae bacterium]
MGRRGQESEFAEYFSARVVPMRRLAYALCGEWHTAEDLVQAAFIRLYRNWGRTRSETIDAYMRKILINVYLSDRRTRSREVTVIEVPDSADLSRADSEVRLDLATALAKLPKRQRAAVVLRYLEDLPIAEVAVLLNVAEGTVKSQAFRAVNALRAALGAPSHVTKEQS